MLASGATTYFHENKTGSVVAMSGATSVLSEGPYTYDAYGNMTGATTGVPFRFTGRRLDSETGLLYYRARYYDPVRGRFPQTDPVGYGPDLDLYTYVGNDPVDKTDPSGKCEEDGCYLEAATFIGAVSGVALQGTADLLTGQLSSNQDYAGAFVGGAAGGLTFATTGQVSLAAGVAEGVSESVSDAYTRGDVDVGTLKTAAIGFVKGVAIGKAAKYASVSGKGPIAKALAKIDAKLFNKAIGSNEKMTNMMFGKMASQQATPSAQTAAKMTVGVTTQGTLAKAAAQAATQGICANATNQGAQNQQSGACTK